MLYSQILGTFLSKTRKRLQLACGSLPHCLPVRTHNTAGLSFLPLLSVTPPPSLVYIPSDFAPVGSSDWNYLKKSSTGCIWNLQRRDCSDFQTVQHPATFGCKGKYSIPVVCTGSHKTKGLERVITTTTVVFLHLHPYLCQCGGRDCGQQNQLCCLSLNCIA